MTVFADPASPQSVSFVRFDQPALQQIKYR